MTLIDIKFRRREVARRQIIGTATYSPVTATYSPVTATTCTITPPSIATHSPCDDLDRSNARSNAISKTPPSIMASSRISRGGHRPEAFTAGRREEGDRIFMVDGGVGGVLRCPCVRHHRRHGRALFLCARCCEMRKEKRSG